MQPSVIARDLDIMGGTLVFRGTRVPVQTLLDYLEAGDSVNDFLDGFPSVTRAQVVAFLEQAKDRLIEAAGRESFSTNASIAGWPVTLSATKSEQRATRGGPGLQTADCWRWFRKASMSL
jgi:uncharacterized protein (DUF433 family)